MRIGLIPLDERPVNTRYPAMIAEIAGVQLVQPPAALLSHRREPADCAGLSDWLVQNAVECDALVVSLEMLGYGGLIASRTTTESAATIIDRLDVLRQIRQANPKVRASGFNLITRISNANSGYEEPPYWSVYGSRFYQYSQLLDRLAQGQDVRDDVQQLASQLPDADVQDFMVRRLRNHIVNLGVLDLAAQAVFDVLVISSDDTSPYGLGTREKRWITEWARRVINDDSRLLMYPGADEVGCVLLARAIHAQARQTPSFALHYAIPGEQDVTAPFEDGPVRITLERQVRAAGGVVVANPNDADFIIAVNTPSRRHPVEVAEYDAGEAAHRTPYLEPFVEAIQAWIEADRRVILADVAYPNGADPVLVDLLLKNADIQRLAAYGAWNTAGNTIGTALAQGIASGLVQTEQQRIAQERFLAHRFLEDWGYMTLVRADVQRAYIEQYGAGDLAPEHVGSVTAMIEAGLHARLTQLPYFGQRWRLSPGSVRLPWARFFEVDFDLEPVNPG